MKGLKSLIEVSKSMQEYLYFTAYFWAMISEHFTHKYVSKIKVLHFLLYF